jgi:hypothetical protein
MFALIHFSAKFRLFLAFDFTVACIMLLGAMEWLKEGSNESLRLDSKIDWSIDGRRIDGEMDELMVDRWTKDSSTDTA